MPVHTLPACLLHTVCISKMNCSTDLTLLQVLESCVKNCGSIIHQELATKETMEFVKDQIKVRNGYHENFWVIIVVAVVAALGVV